MDGYILSRLDCRHRDLDLRCVLAVNSSSHTSSAHLDDDRSTQNGRTLLWSDQRVCAWSTPRILLGRRTDVSVLTVLLSPVLALAPAWWIAVSPSIGYRRIAALVQGTWVGTNPSLAVFVTVGVLITLGAISAAVNSGIIPTTFLVSAPIFGVGATRYGTTLSYSGGAEVGVVSLPSAIGTAIFFAVSIGIPLSAVGFLLGSLSSRIIRVFQSHSAPTSSAEST